MGSHTKERQMMTTKIQAGEYECPQCKKLTVIPRTKKSEDPLTCCGVEMVPKQKVKFTEVPEPKEEPAGKTRTATTATRTKKKASSKAKKAKKPVEVIASEALTLPLNPGNYMCPTCGITKTLQVSDNRDKFLRCPDCFVKMLPS